MDVLNEKLPLARHQGFTIRACRGPFVLAGPGRTKTFENVMGRAETFEILWAGSGHGSSSENLMGRAGPRSVLSTFDRPGWAAAREMWVLYRPLRPPHEAAHVL